MSRAASLPGAELFLKKRTFKNSGTPVRRTRRRESQKMDFQEFWDSCAQNKTSEISKKCTFRDSVTPVCRKKKKRRVSKQNKYELWDSFAQNRTSEFSKNARSRIKRLRCAEQDVGNLKNALSGILGLLCAEQHVGNLKHCTSINYVTRVRRTKRPKSQTLHFQNF